MTLNGVMAVTLRYFTEFGKHAFHTKPPRRSVAECTSLFYFVVRVRCRRTESSRSLSHLLMSFLYIFHTTVSLGQLRSVAITFSVQYSVA